MEGRRGCCQLVPPTPNTRQAEQLGWFSFLVLAGFPHSRGIREQERRAMGKE